jgi:hypothetical protein
VQNVHGRAFALIKIEELGRACDPRFDRLPTCGIEGAIR